MPAVVPSDGALRAASPDEAAPTTIKRARLPVPSGRTGAQDREGAHQTGGHYLDGNGLRGLGDVRR